MRRLSVVRDSRTEGVRRPSGRSHAIWTESESLLGHLQCLCKSLCKNARCWAWKKRMHGNLDWALTAAGDICCCRRWSMSRCSVIGYDIRNSSLVLGEYLAPTLDGSEQGWATRGRSEGPREGRTKKERRRHGRRRPGERRVRATNHMHSTNF